MPETTVLITTYNCGKYIGEAIDSILLQRYSDYQIVVVDDGSTDRTVDILSRYPSLKIISNDENIGISASANKGLADSDSEFVARMDADDVMLGNRLQEQIEFLKHHKDYGMVGSGYQLMDAKGWTIKKISPFTSSDELSVALYFKNQFAQPAVTGRTRMFNELKYDETLSCAEDHDLWVRFSKITKIANLPSTHLSYRLHQKSTCASNQKELKVSVLQVLSRELDNLNVRHDHEDLMLHAAICFGVSFAFFSKPDMRRKVIAWYDKIFGSEYLTERFDNDWLYEFKDRLLLKYCNIVN